MKTPRGIRNNNPLNIRRSKDKWKGMRAPPHSTTLPCCEDGSCVGMVRISQKSRKMKK